MSKIKAGIIGVGSCAKSLVEGVQYYNENPEDKIGLMYEDIGGYSVHDIEFVIGFDIDKRKVNKKLAKALRAQPNCAMDHVEKITTTSNSSAVNNDAMVYSAPEMDGIAPHMHDYPDEVTFVNGAVPAESFERTVELLQYHDVDVLINYLPIQKELKISPSKESDILTPIISFKSPLASFKSSAISSSPPSSLSFKSAFSRWLIED